MADSDVIVSLHLVIPFISMDNCNNDFFNFCHCQVQNFEPVKMRPKFGNKLSKLSKVTKAKAKVNEMH
jgi:hypothetical protein